MNAASQGKEKMKNEFFRFLTVGLFNTLIGMAIIFMLYHLFGLGYWLASGIGYIFGGLVSFFLNKSFTFRYKKKGWAVAVRFFANMLVCYFLAYAVAKPFTYKIFDCLFIRLSEGKQEEIALFVGMSIYTALNFIGQKYICFCRK